MADTPNTPLSEQSIESLGNSITRQWLFDRQIVVYRIASITRPAIDTWVAAVIDDAQAWPADRPYLVMHDTAGFGTTPYGSVRSLEMTRAITGKLTGRYAIVISKGVFGTVVKNFFKNTLSRLIQAMEGQFFFSYDEALDWLKSQLPK